MIKTTTIGAMFALSASTAIAGGIERNVNDYSLLFNSGNSFSFSVNIVNPSVSGDYTARLGGGSTGNMAKSYSTVSMAYANELTDNLTFGLYFNEGYGANSEYTQGFYTGLTADWKSDQVSALLRYSINERISVFGGLRALRSTANIVIPDQMIRASSAASVVESASALAGAPLDATGAATYLAGADAQLTAALTQAGLGGLQPGDAQYDALAAQLTQVRTAAAVLTATGTAPAGAFQYTANGEQTTDFGYVAGVAYEIPDIALRASLTWQGAIEHEFDTSEALPAFGIPGNSKTNVTMPQSLALDFQTGVAPGTLVFGGVKWTEWSKWEVRTPGYESVTGGNVTGFDDDVFTYKLGIGRQFNDKASGFAQITWEPESGGVASRLSPTDGRVSFGVGGQYTDGGMKIRGGIEYVKLGDATDASGVNFSGNSAIGMGLNVNFSF